MTDDYNSWVYKTIHRDEFGRPHNTLHASMLVEHRNIKRYEWYIHGLRHRNGRPAVVIYISDDYNAVEYIKENQWWQNNLLDRADGPAIVIYGVFGIRYEAWYARGYLHRDNGPAIVEYDDHGVAASEQWYQRGRYIPRARIAGVLQPWRHKRVINTLPQPIAEEILEHYKRF